MTFDPFAARDRVPSGPLPPTSRLVRSSLLAAVVIAALHVLAMVAVRPMFQLSDEVAYFSGVQAGALERVSTERLSSTRIAPPNGVIVDKRAPGKPLFQAVVGALYVKLVSRAGAASAAVCLRLVLGLTLVATVLFTFLIARQVAPMQPLVVAGAPLMVALHPVFAGYSAGISPDSLSNALATLTLWLLVRFSSGMGRAWEPLALLAAAATAFLFKDTALFLGFGFVLALIERAVGGRHRLGSWGPVWRRDAGLTISVTLLALAAVLLLGAGRVRDVLTGSSHFPQLTSLLHRIGTGVPLPLDRLTEYIQPVSVFHSFWANLANFGGNEVLLHTELVWLLAAACALGAAGLVWYLLAPPAWEAPRSSTATRREASLLLACSGILLLQAPVRDLAVGAEGAIQGRWLFPMIGPFMVLLCLGWTRLLGDGRRALPFVAFFFGTLAVVALAGVLIPTFYESFPDAYRRENLYLLGPFGRPIDIEALMVLMERPDWLRSAWVAGLPVAAFVGTAFAWPFWVYRLLRREDRSARGKGSAPESPAGASGLRAV